MVLSLPTAKLANPKVQAGAFDASTSLALKRLDLSNDAGKVQFVNSELALKAVEELNGRELLGREAPVERQTEREREIAFFAGARAKRNSPEPLSLYGHTLNDTPGCAIESNNSCIWIVLDRKA